jgi:hypothetical protein
MEGVEFTGRAKGYKDHRLTGTCISPEEEHLGILAHRHERSLSRLGILSSLRQKLRIREYVRPGGLDDGMLLWCRIKCSQLMPGVGPSLICRPVGRRRMGLWAVW